MQQIFSSSNNVGLRMKYRGMKDGDRQGTAVRGAEGACAASVIIWLGNMVTGEARHSRPDEFVASLWYAREYNRMEEFIDLMKKSSRPLDERQGDVRFEIDTGRRNMMQDAGLKVSSALPYYGLLSPQYMRSRPGYYYVNLGEHAVGIVTLNSGIHPGYYLFDPNFGAYLTSPGSEFDTEILDHIRVNYAGSSKYKPIWKLYNVHA